MRAPPPKLFLMRNERSNRHHDPKPPNSMFCALCAAAGPATKVTNPTRRTSRFIGTPPTAPLGSRQQNRVEQQLEGAVRLAPELGPEPKQDHPSAAYRCLHQRRFPCQPLLEPRVAGSQGLLGIRRQGPGRGRYREGGAILEIDLEGLGDSEGNRASRPLPRYPPQNPTENRAWGGKSQNLGARCLTG